MIQDQDAAFGLKSRKQEKSTLIMRFEFLDLYPLRNSHLEMMQWNKFYNMTFSV